MKTSLRGFTLVEMMITVSVMAIGIVMVIRSLLNTVSALETVQNRVEAICLLENRMGELEETALKEKGVKAKESEAQEILLGSRKAVFKSEIEKIEIELEGQNTEDEEKRLIIINEARLRLSWQEGASSKDALLVTYFPVAEE